MTLATERLEALIEFAKQSALLRTTPPQSVAQHKLFNRFEDKIRALPGLHLNTPDGDSDEVWLRLDRLHESKPPSPKSLLLAAWIELPNTPNTEPSLKPRVERKKLIEIGAISSANEETEEQSSFISLDDFGSKDLDSLLKTYLEAEWRAWAALERERRKSISLYSELFMLSQQMQGNLVDTQLELVWGIGVAVWALPNGTITYPLLTQLVEISLIESDMSLVIRPRSSEPRLEVEIYAASDNPGVPKLVAAGHEFFKSTENILNPFEQSTFEGLLRSAATFLDAQGIYWPNEAKPEDRSVPKASEHLIVTDTWVLFARPRTSNLFVQDLERFEKRLTEGVSSLPPAVAALVEEPSSIIEDVRLPAFRGLSPVSGSVNYSSAQSNELYFPMPYNDEQVQIIQLLEVNDGVVVQGPPGTGKTHTIANIICHYLALGKRVLVTSMKDPALSVLRDKLPNDIQPLAISLLTSEAEGMKHFEFAINKISAEVRRIDRLATKREIEQIDRQIDEVHARIAKIDREIAGWAARNLSQITLDGSKLNPAEAAKEVAASQSEITWLTDQISISSEHQAQFTDADIISLRTARLSIGADIAYLNKKIPQILDFPDSKKLLQVHQDLSHASKLKEKESSGEVPLLADNSPETIQASSTLAAQLNNLRLLIQDLEAANQNWVPSMVAYLRKSRQNEIIDLFLELKADIESTLAQRKQFLAKPVSLPEGFDANQEVVEAVRNLSQGRRPFGLIGLLGKADQKRHLDAVQLAGAKPQCQADWEHIAKFVDLQRQNRALLTRWNTLANELPLPTVDNDPSKLVIAGQALEHYNKIISMLQQENIVSQGLMRVLPGWKSADQLAQNQLVLAEAESILTHHLTRHRLAETWVIKETFLKAISGCEGEITARLNDFFHLTLGNPEIPDTQVQADWSALMAELRRIHDLAPHLRTLSNVTAAIEASGALEWADSLRRTPYENTNDTLLPSNWQDVWRLRRLATYLDSIDCRQELKRLSVERTELENDLGKLYRDAICKRTWLRLSENATHDVRAALEAYRAAITKIGKGTGVRAGRYRQDARLAAERANAAIPCWIMPHYRISEALPATLGGFDLIIIDEASQSDLTALPAILRGKKVLIVGDDKQVSPEGVGLEEEKVRSLITRFLSNQVAIYRPQMTPERSIYDLFKVVFAKSSVMLREHFRSVAPIIEYSKREFYNHELRPLRHPTASERLDPPLIDVYVEDGYRDKDLNKPEANFIVEEIRRIAENPALEGRTIGVVSLLGDKQALYIMQLLSEQLGEEVITRFHIACGDARTFQGKERDIMFLSMVASPGKAHAQTQAMTAQRFNVAASRARDRMYLVRSIALEDLSQADILRSRLIQHFQAPFGQDPVEVTDLRQLCESPFEREVFDLLVERGYRVIPQVPVGTYRIDMVVEGENDNRLAIECDGDRYHGPEQWDSDMNRQRILERAGWKFWRCFASTFALQRDEVIKDLVQTLQAHGIAPTGSLAPHQSLYVEHRSVVAMPADQPQVEEEQSEDAIVQPSVTSINFSSIDAH